VDRYEIHEEVAPSGMGIVFKAWDPVLKRPVALKVIRSGNLASREETLRFLRDAQAAAQFDDPHIMRILEIGEYGGQPYFTMPFVAGGSLGQNLPRLVSDPRAAVALLEKIARAVHRIHARSILHRDLKPSNVLLDEQGEPLVADFGLAKFLDEGPELTRSHQQMGTLPYMAPEQVAGDSRRVGVPADIWALGIILYELLTGRRPFIGETRGELEHRILHAPPPRSGTGRRIPDPALEAVVQKCLEKTPQDRYASAEALADDLRLWLNGELSPPPRWKRVGRAARRHAPTLVVLSGSAVLAVVLFLLLLPSDPRRQLKTWQGDLAAGKPATFIDLARSEKFFPSILGKAETVDSPAHDGTYTLLALQTVSLVEILPAVPRDHYRFRVEICHHDSAVGEVGIYFLHHTYPTERGEEHGFCTWTFNDREALITKDPARHEMTSEVALDLWRAREPGRREKIAAGVRQELTPAVQTQPGARPWRTMAVEVGPDQLQVFWENQAFPPVLFKQLQDLFGRINRPWDRENYNSDLHFSISPRGGLGLYVYRGMVSFRRVVVEPLE
jgi:serine/threonine-protein kinase